ncbi:AF1514 family protein [Thermodesulfobacteriota bacterium]
MQEINITISGQDINQEQAQKLARILAEQENPETMIISRFNRIADACSPCCLKGNIGEKPGWQVYGENHGGRKIINVNNGEYVFIFS